LFSGSPSQTDRRAHASCHAAASWHAFASWHTDASQRVIASWHAVVVWHAGASWDAVLADASAVTGRKLTKTFIFVTLLKLESMGLICNLLMVRGLS
jgi:hypothetical protein